MKGVLIDVGEGIRVVVRKGTLAVSVVMNRIGMRNILVRLYFFVRIGDNLDRIGIILNPGNRDILV